MEKFQYVQVKRTVKAQTEVQMQWIWNRERSQVKRDWLTDARSTIWKPLLSDTQTGLELSFHLTIFDSQLEHSDVERLKLSTKKLSVNTSWLCLTNELGPTPYGFALRTNHASKRIYTHSRFKPDKLSRLTPATQAQDKHFFATFYHPIHNGTCGSTYSSNRFAVRPKPELGHSRTVG